MKRLVLNGPRDARIIEEKLPELKPYEILCKVKYVCICGTDFEIASGESSFVKNGLIKYPVPIGHEWSGVVAGFGSDAKDKGFSLNDRVISDTGVACGECEACKKGDYKRCPKIRAVGTINAYPGAFAEYVIFPYWHLHHIPDSVALDEAALLEPTSIANHAIVRSKIYTRPGFAENATTLVTGTGGIGIAAALLLKHCYNVKKVIVAGRKDDKLKVALEGGIDAVINTVKTDFVEEMKRLTDGKGANLVIETSGSIDIFNKLVYVTSLFGEIAPLAFYSRTLDGFDIDTLINSCMDILGIGGQEGLMDVMKFLGEGKLSLLPVISHRISLEEAVNAFNDPSKYSATKIKIMVEM